MTAQSYVKYQESPRSFYTQIPNIVYEMLEARLISNSDFILYSTYRRIAGENGACWIGSRKLAEKCQLNKDTITSSKKHLSQPFECLNGKSLIEVSAGDKKLEEADIVTVMDIWNENEYFFKNKLTCPKRRYTPVRKEGTPLSEKKVHKNNHIIITKEEHKQSSSLPSSFQKQTIEEKPDKLDPPKVPIDDLIDDGVKLKKDDSIEFTTPKGEKRFIDSTVIYRHFLKLSYSTETVQAAIQKFKKEQYPVSNILKYLESICKTLQNQKSLKNKKKDAIMLDQTEEKPMPKHKYVRGLFECTKSTIFHT